MTAFEREARAGFPRMRGGRLRASLPIRQAVLDEWLRGTGVRVDILDRNQVLVVYGSARVKAEIVGVTPGLAVVLQTPWWSRAALWGALTVKPGLASYVRQADGLVYVMCGAIPAVARLRWLWRHVSGVLVETVPGMLVLQVDAVLGRGVSRHGMAGRDDRDAVFAVRGTADYGDGAVAGGARQ